jgi:tetratricopeptide (TPR) repeat protein
MGEWSKRMNNGVEIIATSNFLQSRINLYLYAMDSGEGRDWMARLIIRFLQQFDAVLPENGGIILAFSTSFSEYLKALIDNLNNLNDAGFINCPPKPKQHDLAADEAKKYYSQGEYDKALPLFKQVAEFGDAKVQNYLGLICKDGVEQDFEQAVFWFSKAAEQGLDCAQFNLGMMYQDGHGVEQDDKQAIFWLSKASKQGHRVAQMCLPRH